MLYNEKEMTLPEYYETRMREDGFYGNDLECINGLYRDEVEYWILAEYCSSCEFNLKELDFIESLGYTAEDFNEPKWYEVVLEAGTIRKVVCQTYKYREALECFEAFDEGDGCYKDENNFVWDIYIDEWERDSMEHVKDLWDEFGDIPMNPETECIEKEWHGFPAGTHREDIWHWFEDTFHVSVAEDLMYA